MSFWRSVVCVYRPHIVEGYQSKFVESTFMIRLVMALFIFWVILSGKIDAFHLSLGLLSSLSVAWVSRRLRRLDPPLVSPPAWLRWPGYLLWLFKEVVVSSVQVAMIVLSPKMPINPRVVRLRRYLPNDLAKLTLANSITLTPGTVTVDLEGKDFIVHALTEEGALTLVPRTGEGEMARRVKALFIGRGSA